MALPAKQEHKSNVEYTELLEKLNDIPTLPVVAMKVNELINDPTSSVKDITEVLKRDQVLTAKILKLANSSYYAIPGGCSDVQKALAFLGFNTLAQLILGLSILNVFSRNKSGEEFSMIEFWRHALGTAVCSELLAKKLDYEKPEEAFTCGLLHDIGKLVLHEIDKDRLFVILREAKQREASFIEIEKEFELPSHCYLGEVIATKWNLPQVIRQAIRYHHVDVNPMQTILASNKKIISIVRLSNTICVKNEIGFSGDCSEGQIPNDMLSPLGLDINNVPEIEKQLEEEMERAGSFLSVIR